MATPSIQETRQTAMQSATNFLITTPVTEQTYYTLYVHNPQVSCICALFNRIIYFLFSWMECCLGKASDQSKKISMQNEITLIRNFTTAEKELLSALRAAENSQGQGAQQETQQGTQKEEENYFEALNARQEQINSFTFSQEALAQGCQQVDLVGAARLRFQQQLNGTPLPASLMNMPSQVEPEPSSTSSGLKQLQSWQETEKSPITPSSSQLNPPLSKKSKEEIMEDTRKIVTDKLLENPDFTSVANADIQKHIQAVKAYCESRTDNSSEDFTLFYKELNVMSRDLSTLRDKRLPLVLEFAKQLGLPKSDPKFIDTYTAQIRLYYIDQHFSYPALMYLHGGAYALLKSYFDAIEEIYRTVHPDASKEETADYAKKQVTMLLADVHKGYAAKYANLSNDSTPRKNEAYQLAQHLSCFAADAEPNAKTKGTQFIEDVLNGKAAGTTKATVQDSQSSASQSTALSQPSVISVSPSSSTSTVRSTTTSSLGTQTLEGGKLNPAQDYLTARDELFKLFGELQIVDLIPKNIIQNFATKLRKYSEKFNYIPQELLKTFHQHCYSIGFDPDTGDKPVGPNEILRLNVYVAHELGIADTGFLEKAIIDMFNETVFGSTRSFVPSVIKKQSRSTESNIFHIFFTTVKHLSALVQPKCDPSTYAKEKLKNLFTAIHTDKTMSEYYAGYAKGNISPQTSAEELLIKIALALAGFGPGASKEAQGKAEDLLTSIITSTGS